MAVSRSLRRIGLSAFFFAQLLNPSDAEQAEIWNEVADMPTARLGLATAESGDILFAVGGYPAISTPGLTTFETYDIRTAEWSTGPDLPTGRRWLTASVADGKLFAIGGGLIGPRGPAVSSVDAYDPMSKTWEPRAEMPTPRFGLASSVVDGEIYAIGGTPNGSQLLSEVQAYDPITDSWSHLAAMPTPRGLLSTAVVDGTIYALGGLGQGGVRDTLEQYDPETDRWTQRASMPTARAAFSTAVFDGKIYAIGGRTAGASSSTLSTVEIYDPSVDRWTITAGLPSPSFGAASATLGDQIYVLGGAVTTTPPHPGMATVYVLDPTLDNSVAVISSLNVPYTQNFDALGADGSRPGTLMPDGWTGEGEHTFRIVDGAFDSTRVLRNASFFNAGVDDDRALTTLVPRRGDASELQFNAVLEGTDATQLRLQFDLEAWGAPRLKSSDPPGEAAFQVVAELDSGDGFAQLLDLGTVSTGQELSVPDDLILNGNLDELSTSYDSAWSSELVIPEGSTLRMRWVPEKTDATSGWTYGIDNVELTLGLFGDVNRDGLIDRQDIDLVSHEVSRPTGNEGFDLTRDGQVNRDDVDKLLGLANRSNGDADFNGLVDFSDFVILSNNFGQDDKAWSDGDFNSNGSVRFDDFVILSSNFSGASRAAVSIPEPCSFALAAVGLITLSWRRNLWALNR